LLIDGNTVLEDQMLLARIAWQVLRLNLPSSRRFVSLSIRWVHEASPPMQAESGPSSPLGTSPVAELAAEEAYAHWGAGRTCVFDVLTTGDLEAMVGAY
jgi:hypothetical protein